MGLMNYTGHSTLETGAELFGKKCAKMNFLEKSSQKEAFLKDS